MAQSLHKKLWVTIGDRTFSLKWKGMPDYLSDDAEYQGGIVFQYSYPGTKSGTNKTPNGVVAMQWNPAVRARYQKLLRALAARFDGRIYGIDLGETAMDADLPEGERASPATAISTRRWKTSPSRARRSTRPRSRCSQTSGPANGRTAGII